MWFKDGGFEIGHVCGFIYERQEYNKVVTTYTFNRD